MSVTYRRTFNLTYGIGESFTDNDKSLFFNYLKDSQIFTTCNDDRDIEYYGIHTKQEEKYVYQVMLDEDTRQGEPLDWSHTAEAVVKVMGDLYPNMTVKRETIIGDVDHVILPTERRLVFGDPLARGLKHTLPSNNEIIFDYGSGIGMTVSVWFHNYNQTFDLDFSIEYVTKSVIRNTDIEEVLTEIPKFAMGFIQARVEEALETFLLSIPTPTINCNFECINTSRSECDIEVVTKTRDARNEFRSEEE
tara:strand:- start:225 stop:971 length:747 start_codon:yes stop_codon:yes gene_type:complete